MRFQGFCYPPLFYLFKLQEMSCSQSRCLSFAIFFFCHQILFKKYNTILCRVWCIDLFQFVCVYVHTLGFRSIFRYRALVCLLLSLVRMWILEWNLPLLPFSPHCFPVELQSSVVLPSLTDAQPLLYHDRVSGRFTTHHRELPRKSLTPFQWLPF